ncbi:hypothetical protein H2200_000070 [Cladophialophora chaetospira]|uniref:Uncharacterized protein n=1 Tax=Cladophialophora chaetospira TaxID=386627 RepID=A0AA38XMV9_9EURO|nr:hypothetical protein H2200_000070 [Cladophialophora chaetospira]
MTRGPICIAVTGAIGLTTEAVAAVKGNRGKPDDAAHRKQYSDDDEEVQYLEQMSTSNMETFTSEALMTMPVKTRHLQPLELPVIIPQRRPRNRSRGFLRAYAPALQGSQIDPAMFFSFLNGFDEEIKKQGLFIVANLAVSASVITATSLVGHNPFVDVAAFAVHSTIEAGRRMYITHKYNKYMHNMNEKFFQPRGLYALIMDYKPRSDSATEIVDLQTQVALSAANGGDTGSKFKVSSGATHNELEMPDAAPLVFPNLNGNQKQNALQKASEFLGNYSDRRAQAVFAAQNPDSSLITGQPKPEFSSRYADPNHAVNKGGPLAVLTGGKVSLQAREQKKKEQENLAAGRPLDEGTGGIVGGLKRLVRENVMYLMIVKMPSEKELMRAAELAAQYHQG